MAGVSRDGRGGLFNSGFPFYAAAGIGIVPGATRVTALGHNPNIATIGLTAEVWEGTTAFTFLAAASTLEVLSSSASDTAAGTGARTVLISGLNASYATITETVTLNGTTPVSTVNQYLRVNVFTTTTSGSGETNAGDITLRVVSGGAVQSIARAGYGFGRSCIYTVPAGFTLFIKSLVFTVLAADPKTNAGATFGVFQRSNVGNRRTPLEFQVLSTSPYRHEADLGIVLTQRTDFSIRATAQQINTNVTAAMEGLLIDNTFLVGI
jgi:hypothetical protein